MFLSMGFAAFNKWEDCQNGQIENGGEIFMLAVLGTTRELKRNMKNSIC